MQKRRMSRVRGVQRLEAGDFCTCWDGGPRDSRFCVLETVGVRLRHRRVIRGNAMSHVSVGGRIH